MDYQRDYDDFHKTGQVGKARTYVVEGIGEDFFPTTMDMKILDDVIQVSDEECFVVARRLVFRQPERLCPHNRARRPHSFCRRTSFIVVILDAGRVMVGAAGGEGD